jgi:uncharacterized membrane protein
MIWRAIGLIALGLGLLLTPLGLWVGHRPGDVEGSMMGSGLFLLGCVALLVSLLALLPWLRSRRGPTSTRRE